MKFIFLIVGMTVLAGCGKLTITNGDSITATELESFFRKHKIDNNYAVALKKRSTSDAYLATIHGYPDNLSVCKSLIEPYNKDLSLSVISGNYYCEELH